MALLQPATAIYHHPLDTTTESLQSDVWTAEIKPVADTVNLTTAKVSSGMLPEVIYNPDLGTVPDSQGWTLVEVNGPAAASVSGGILTQSTAFDNSKVQLWRRTGLDDFGDLATGKFEVEFDLKIITSTYDPGGTFWRTGWSAFMADANKRGFFFGVSDTGVRLSPDLGPPGSEGDNANSAAFVATATTDDFHKYRVSVSGGVWRVFKDGSLLTSIATGPGNNSVANRIQFGLGSSLTNGNIRLRKIVFPSATLNGTGASYPSVIGSTKLAYTGWMKNPSAQ